MKRQIPNLFTLGNLLCGFLSLQFSVSGDLRNAAILIFIAIMLDAVDGRVARILGVANDFGKQLDSLADVVSFGVAPAYLVFYTYLTGLEIWGLLLTALFPLFGAYRLARFNITKTTESLQYFTGIPITLAGGIVTLLTLVHQHINVVLFMVIFYIIAVLMVSTIKIPSLKDVKLPKNGIITSIFMVYMLYLLWKNNFTGISVYYCLAFLLYVVFIALRFIKEKDVYKKQYKKKK
ncbi:MAG: CDP-diacylglycerol--serine O-phosphatidyltransferase [Bacillus sp. (in: firmicutes)]